MADNTIIQQGTFVSDGSASFIELRGGVEWMRVYNYTQIAAPAAVGYEYYWQLGMPTGGGLVWTNPAAPAVTALANPAGFTLVDTSLRTQTVSPNVITNITNANPPVLSSVAHGLVTGDIVLISNAVGAYQLGSVPFYVTRLTADTFNLTFMGAIAAAAAPGATARIRKIGNASYWVPTANIITKLTQAVQAVVTFSAPHSFRVGSQVRFKMPRVTATAYGMTQLNDVTANVLAVNLATNSITVDVDTTGFGAFAFPLTADIAFTYAQCVPVGEDTATALSLGVDILGDAQFNDAFIGMKLGGGANTPGGAANDLMYWVAGKSFSNLVIN